jgi:aminopeptidase N
MRWYSQVLGYEYPYDKYAQTIVGNFMFGGMENITATTFADTEILYADESLPGGSSVDLVSHELAHSWFGDMVTCRDWAHLWLNEGFATFMEASYREHQDGREAYLAALQVDAKDYFREDPSRKRHPLVNPRYPLSMDLFDETTYKKGAFVIHMLRETVGDETFWKALNVYLNEYKYRNVETRDLQKVFERVSGQQLEWFFDQWVYKAGYPELRVRSKYDAAQRQLTLTVAQTQSPASNTPAVFRLPVEIEILTETGWHTERIEINQRAQSFNIKLDAAPRSVIFDRKAGLLKKLDFPEPRTAGATPYLLLDGAEVVTRQATARAFDTQRVRVASNVLMNESIQSGAGSWPWASFGRLAENSIR